MSKIIIASNNKGKIKEFSDILTLLGFEVISLKDVGIDIDIEENGTTFQENAVIKARTIFEMTKTSVIADDSGLMVEYLNGAPGIYSHRYGGENATDDDKNQKILSELKDIPDEKRKAKFVCSICYIDENGKEQFVNGECIGKIGYEPKGENGFGYDPIFMYGDKSFAEISSEEKNKVSHRAVALKSLYDIMKG